MPRGQKNEKNIFENFDFFYDFTPFFGALRGSVGPPGAKIGSLGLKTNLKSPIES